MENYTTNAKLVQDFQDASHPSLLQQLKGNILVPIGIVMTVGCYAVGLSSLVTSQPMLGQKMMYARVAFQGMTVAAMFYDQWLDRKTMRDRITCNHQRYDPQDFSVCLHTNK